MIETLLALGVCVGIAFTAIRSSMPAAPEAEQPFPPIPEGTVLIDLADVEDPPVPQVEEAVSTLDDEAPTTTWMPDLLVEQTPVLVSTEAPVEMAAVVVAEPAAVATTVLEQVAPAPASIEYPWMRPDADRLIQTEVAVKAGAVERMIALTRLALAIIGMGVLFAGGLIGAVGAIVRALKH